MNETGPFPGQTGFWRIGGRAGNSLLSRFAVSLLFLGVAGLRQRRQGHFQIASSLFDVKGASMILLDNKDEHGDNLYLAGEKVPPGRYKQVESGRIIFLEEEDYLPASLDGRIACYLAIRHVSKRQVEESNT